MREGDAQILSDEEAAQGWAPTLEKHRNRLKDQSEGKAVCWKSTGGMESEVF